MNRQIVLVETPRGPLTAAHFRLVEAPMPVPGDGEILVRVLRISLDAANRAWMNGATYRARIEPGAVMAGASIAEVVESRAEGFAPGDLVFADTGWRDFATLPGRRASKVPRMEPLDYLLSVFGISGLTAYFGLLDVAAAEPGETVLVSAAAGSVGSLVGQIAKLHGCRAVGIAGGPEKCRVLTDDLGFDAAVDYKSDGFRAALAEAVPDGVDVYFDNVGGPLLDAALYRMNLRGRVACCGAIASYDGAAAAGPRFVPSLVITKRLRLEGFIVMDFRDRYPEALAALQGWVAAGELVVRHDRVQGLENAPAGLVGLLAGENIGKRIVVVHES